MRKLTKKRIAEIKTTYANFIFTDKIINEIKDSISNIQEYQNRSNYLKNAYFWDSPSHASDRRAYEKKFSLSLEANFFTESYLLEITVQCTCKHIYVSKNKNSNEIKAILKNIQEILYVLTFDQYKNIIEKIDSIIETKRSVNHNDILFTEEYYEKNIGITFLKNYTKVNLSKADKERLEELKAKKGKVV